MAALGAPRRCLALLAVAALAACATVLLGPALPATAAAEPLVISGHAVLGCPAPATCQPAPKGTNHVHAGDPVTWTIVVTNQTNHNAQDVAVTDALVPGCAKALGVVPAATSSTYSCSGKAPHASFVNVADVTGSDGADGPMTGSGSVPLTVISPAISITATAGRAGYRVGETVRYTITVTNTGDAALTTVAVTDKVTRSCARSIGTLAPGRSNTYTCTALAAVTKANTAAVSGRDVLNKTVTDTSTMRVPVTPRTLTVPAVVAPTVVPASGLTLVKSALPTTVSSAGTQVTYSFDVTNTSTGFISNLAIDDTLTAPAGPALDVTCPQTTIAPTESTTCTATYQVTQDDIDHGVIDNAAVATGADEGNGLLSSNESQTEVTVIQAPSIGLSKHSNRATVSAAGQVVTYTFDVTNTGNVTIAGVHVDDTFTPPAGPLSPITCLLTTLAPAQATTCTATYPVSPADLDTGSIKNSATASGTAPDNSAVTSDPSTASITAIAQPAVSLVKHAQVNDVNNDGVTGVGDTISWTFTVTNTGNVTLNQVTVADPVAGPVTCTSASLAAEADVDCSAAPHVITQVDVDAGHVANTATASGTDPFGTTVSSTPAGADTLIPPVGGLTLTKTALPGSVNSLGDTVTYSFLVTNTGNVTIDDVAIDDTPVLPAGPAPAVGCPPGPLAPTNSITCTATYRVTQPDLDHGVIDNSATASGVDPGGAPVTSLPATSRVTVVQTATLSLVKSASPATIATVGQHVTYSFAVRNTGNVTETDVAVVDALTAPAGPPLTVGCPSTQLGPGDFTICSATYVSTQQDFDNGSIDNMATASGTDPTGEPVASNASLATVGITEVPTLTVEKSAAPATVTAAGQSVMYTFVVTNTGNVTVDGVAIDDTLAPPAGPAFPITCPATPVAPTETTTCTGTYHVSQADADEGSIANTAVATGTSAGGASVTSLPSNITVTVTPSPALTLAKTATPTTVTAAGQSVTYSFLVTNTGNVTIHDLAINDTLLAPAGPALSVICPATILAPTETTTCHATYVVRPTDMNAGAIHNTATASGSAPAGDQAESDPSSATVTATPLPALTIVKHASVATVTTIGAVITYTFTVGNTGNVTLSAIAVTDTFSAPAGPELTPTCPASPIDPGESTVCTASYAATAADFDHGSIRNSATATGTPPAGAQVTSDPSTSTVTAAPLPAISLVKAAAVVDVDEDGVPDLNDTILWTFSLTNTGNVTLVDIAVQDPVAGAVTCPPDPLAAGATATCTANTAHVIDQRDVDAGHVDNTANASGTSPTTGTSVTSNASSTMTLIGAFPGLSLVTQGSFVDANDDGAVDAGDHITWTFVVTNLGNVTVTDLAITDAAAGVATCLVTTLAPAVTTTCTADDPQTVTVADLDAGSVTTTATAAGFGPDGAAVSAPPSTATVPLPGRPALGLVKSASVSDTTHDGVTGAGDTVVWRFAVTDVGNVTVQDIAVIDPTAGRIDCPRAALHPDAAMTCRSAAHRISAAEAARGELSNTATVFGVGRGGAAIVSPPSTATIQTRRLPAPDTATTGPVAFTGPTDLPGLVWFGLWSLLLGAMLTTGGHARRRRVL